MRLGEEALAGAEGAAMRPNVESASNQAVRASDSLRALCTLARFHHVAADADVLAHQLGLAASDRVGIDDLLRAARQLGLKAKRVQTRLDRLALSPLPALAVLRRDAGDGDTSVRVVVLAQCDAQRVLLQEGNSTRATIEPLDVFSAQWTGELILITSRASLAGELARFDFSWFIPSLVKYRRLLGEVLAISFMLQLFALVSPLFFQVVMDKVLVHRGMTTLDVIVIGLVVVVVFESVLSGLRAYVFSHTTSRIDVELGARLFRHLVQLPLAYFQARRVGDSVARVRELENIRSFLTGNALTVVLDVLFSIVFIAVMLFYSVSLTLIVLASLPLYFGLSLAVVPVLRRRLDHKFARGAENQALLVETITGIQTVKATALEPAFARRWDNQLAAYVAASFKTQNLATWAHEGVNLIGKLVIGFVRAGQDASIKMETFLYTRYGTVPATVRWVTPDAVSDEKRGAVFPAKLALRVKQIDVDGKPVGLAPGMSLTAEIKTGERRVIEYLLSPIQRVTNESLRER